MHVSPELISVVVVALVALLAGMAFTRIGQPALVGYILTGLVLGPSGAALIESRESIAFLAELGVLLLLFFVGMELSLRGFRAVWKVATMIALLQIGAATGIMFVVSTFTGWSAGTTVLLGFVVALSSTAVAVNMLRNLNILQTQVGQLTVSVLIAQDLAIVPMLLIMGILTGEGVQSVDAVKLAVCIALLSVVVWYLSRREKVALPLSGQLAKNPELRPLYGLVLCFGAALITALLGLTAAYGAFLAGLLVGNSTARRTVMQSVHPVQSILMMVFFLSVGLLIDLAFVWSHLGQVVAILFIVTVVKTALNVGIMTLLREPWLHAFISGVMLAQIGEFSFLLGAVGNASGLIDANEFNLIVTVTAFSLIISPVWLVAARRFLRIALVGTSSLDDAIKLLREGGMMAVWRATKSRVMPMPLARRVLGRPRRATPAAASAKEKSPKQDQEDNGEP
ncbi:MAG: cation:proton antiporter [Rhodospirillales bacterium]